MREGGGQGNHQNRFRANPLDLEQGDATERWQAEGTLPDEYFEDIIPLQLRRIGFVDTTQNGGFYLIELC